MVAVPCLVGSAWLVGFVVTVVLDATIVGAVYKPELLIVPNAGLLDHVTPVLLVPVTVALNCCVPPAWRFGGDDGVTLTDIAEGETVRLNWRGGGAPAPSVY